MAYSQVCGRESVNTCGQWLMYYIWGSVSPVCGACVKLSGLESADTHYTAVGRVPFTSLHQHSQLFL